MPLNRRSFIKRSGAISLGFAGLHTFIGCRPPMSETVGYGPLVADPGGILDLPDGFSYRVLSRLGDRMDDGLLVPGEPDGMAALPGPDGLTILVRNHELGPGTASSHGAFGENYELLTDDIRSKMYDEGIERPCQGGTTTLIYDTQDQKVVSQYLSLAGTLTNCAGRTDAMGNVDHMRRDHDNGWRARQQESRIRLRSARFGHSTAGGGRTTSSDGSFQTRSRRC